MSSTPPKTPSKQAMAVSNDDLTAPRPPSTPLPDGVRKESQRDEPLLKLKEDHSQQIQIPSSNLRHSQHDVGQHEEEGEETSSNGRVRDAIDGPTEDLTEIAEDEQLSEDKSATEDNIDIDPMDWTAFEMDYMKALKVVDDEEGALLTEFEKVADAFTRWAEASGGHDNERAVKRLKTRERFVELSEHELEKKKKHYAEVVDAFKKALALLTG